MPPITFRAENECQQDHFVYDNGKRLYIGYIDGNDKPVRYYNADSPVVDIGFTRQTLQQRFKSKRASQRARLQRFCEASRFEASSINYRHITTDAIFWKNVAEDDGITILDLENVLQWYFIFGARMLPLANEITGTGLSRKARYCEVRKLAELHARGTLKWENIFPRAEGVFLDRLNKAADKIRTFPQARSRCGPDEIPLDCHLIIQGGFGWYCSKDAGDAFSLSEWCFARDKYPNAHCKVDKGREPLKQLTDWITDRL